MVSVLCGAALHGAAHLYVAAHPWGCACGQMVSVLCVAASHGAAQFSVFPRPMVPRTLVLPRSLVPRTCMLPRPMVPRVRPNGLSSLCCRVPWCRAGGQMVSVLCVAASHGAAQFYMLPRSMRPRLGP